VRAPRMWADSRHVGEIAAEAAGGLGAEDVGRFSSEANAGADADDLGVFAAEAVADASTIVESIRIRCQRNSSKFGCSRVSTVSPSAKHTVDSLRRHLLRWNRTIERCALFCFPYYKHLLGTRAWYACSC